MPKKAKETLTKKLSGTHLLKQKPFPSSSGSEQSSQADWLSLSFF